jgi:ATP-dependent exoDNAse (exonuclease V) beta subunit
MKLSIRFIYLTELIRYIKSTHDSKMTLSRINHHLRDDNITFKDENHEYTIIGMKKKPISVTTLIHRFFPEFNADNVITKMMSSSQWTQSQYFGLTRESIKEEWDISGKNASRLGTIMHKSIEQYLNNETVDDPNSKEFSMFLEFWRDIKKIYPTLTLYRTEWLIWHEYGIAGSIDCVISDSNGDFIIIDWKRSKEIKEENKYEKGYGPFSNFDNCNYWHYTLQLNFYRHIIETRYNKPVIYMMLVVLHPNQSSYKCYPIQRIDLSDIWHSLI